MLTVGLDIGSYALKCVVLNKKGQEFEVVRAVEVPNPIGIVIPDTPQQRQQLLDTINTLFSDSTIPKENIHVGLAESLVSTKVVRMPLLSDAELASAIQWQVEQHIPIPLDQMQYEYSVLRRSDRKDSEQTMDVLMIGTKKQLIQGLADLFLDANLDVEFMETDILAQMRVLQNSISPEENVAFLHIGASSSVMALIAKGVLQFVHAAPIGGALFSRAVEQGVGLDPVRAEEYKRTYGLLANQLEGRVRQALSPIVDSLASELRKTLHFFSGQNTGQQIQRVFVTGGSLYLPDLLPSLSQAVSIELVPLDLVSLPILKWKEATKQENRFVVAIGLAMRSE